jgi:hypothetical protein
MTIDLFRRFICGALLCAIVPAYAAQVTVERDTPIYAEARADSRIAAQLKQGAVGEVIGQAGAWLQLRTPAATGWLFSFNVRYQSAAGSGTAGGAAETLGRIAGPRQNVNVTAVIGIRGLDEEDLRQARFDAAQVQLLEQYAATREQAEAAASDRGLAPVRVEFVEARP